MRTFVKIKDYAREIHLIQHRIVTSLALVLILCGLLFARFFYLQVYQHDLYTTLSKKNWLDLVPIEPSRGLIYDRNGVLLAKNIPTYSLDIIADKTANINKTIAILQQIIPISETEITNFKKQLATKRRFAEVSLKLHLTDSEIAKIAVNQYRLPGVRIKARLIRYYPFGAKLVHILGYVGRINAFDLIKLDQGNYSASNYIGKVGLEKNYESILHGKVGYEQVETDATGKKIRTLSFARPMAGYDIVLTIDSALQIVAEKALGQHKGAIVALKPTTGEVLALVSSPGYDPNLFVSGMSREQFQALQTSHEEPLFNRALRGLYPMASTVKPFLALAGLDANIIDSEYIIEDPGWYRLPNSSHVFHDWKPSGHGTVNLAKAIVESVDTYFYDLANRLGIRRIDDFLGQFGFGSLTGIDIGEELSIPLPTPEWKERRFGASWYPGDTVQAGIGQGFMQTTIIQLANATATLATRGDRFQPYLVQSLKRDRKKIATQPILLEHIKLQNKKHWQQVISAMQKVITDAYGTGFRFGKNASYTVAAKTGTAQVYSKDKKLQADGEIPTFLRDHSLFIAFAPVDKPEIALAVVVENSNRASLVARRVMDYYLHNSIQERVDKRS